MKNRNSTFSLTIMVITMAVLAVFVGYLLGNWLIQMVTGDTATHQVMENKIIEEETIEDDNHSRDENESSITINDKQNEVEQIKGEVFVVQVGAFKNYENAIDLKGELESEGFQVIVTEVSPYKVQLGATTNREEAERTEDKVESLGYNAFITH